MKLCVVFQYLAPDSERYAVYDSNSYDGAEDAGAQLIGYGKTAEDAKAVFTDKWMERECERDCKAALGQVKLWDSLIDRLFHR